MKRASSLTLTLLGLVLSSSVLAHSFEVGDLKINHPWARPTVQGQAAGGGFLKITNKGKVADRLISAQTSGPADHMELHTMTMEGDVMKMRQVEGIDIPPGATVELKPGALHVMFMGLKAPLKDGDKLPVTLKFEKAGEVKIEMWVQNIGSGEDKMDPKEHKHH